MARSPINTIATDLQSDSGSVLWSFVRGEQLEFPISLSFVNNASSGYIYEAVVVEALNIANDPTVPNDIRAGGCQTRLVVRVPTDRGTWSAAGSYNREEFVLYSGLYYKLSAGAARVNATIPPSDPVWQAYIPNQIYVQFPSTLSMAGPSSPCTFTDTGDLVTKTAHGLVQGQQVAFYNIVATTGILTGQYYYVINPTANTFQLATTYNQYNNYAGITPVTLTTNGTGDLYTDIPYAVTPTANTPVYGFFELRVTEPSGGVYTRTWKPVRGMVEILFSPTDLVV
jgi:hypothetical protein